MSVQISISYGEFFDRISILKIKSERMTDREKVTNVREELSLLLKMWPDSAKSDMIIEVEIKKLKAVNERLWETEDAIREKERRQEFDEEFIRLARSIYVLNDERANIKRRINRQLGSDLTEEKSYPHY